MTKNTRKHNGRVITDDIRRAAVQMVMDGETKAAVARKFGIPESTLRGWCKKAKELAEGPKVKRAKLDSSISEEANGSEEIKKRLSHPVENPPHNALLDLSRNSFDAQQIENLTVKTASKAEELARVGREFGLNQPETFNNNNGKFTPLQRIHEILSTQPKTVEEENLRNYLVWCLAAEQLQVNPPKEQKSPNGYRAPGAPNHHKIAASSTSPNPRPVYKPVPSTSTLSTVPVVTSTSTNFVPTPAKVPEMPTLPLNYTKTTSPALNTVSTTSQGPSKLNRTPSPVEVVLPKAHENPKITTVNDPTSSVLRNLLLLGQSEAEAASSSSASFVEVVKSGEQFLTWMMSPNNSLVTMSERMMMMQILERVKNAEDRRNGVAGVETKTGRKYAVPRRVLKAV